MKKYFSNLIASLAVCVVLVVCVPVVAVAGLAGSVEVVEKRFSVFKNRLKAKYNED